MDLSPSGKLRHRLESVIGDFRLYFEVCGSTQKPTQKKSFILLVSRRAYLQNWTSVWLLKQLVNKDLDLPEICYQ
jgi:hypothetical protein